MGAATRPGHLFKPAAYTYHINLDERGEFYADVRNSAGNTVFEIHGFEIFEDGFMRHKNDVDGLHEYLAALGVMRPGQTLAAVH